MAERAAQPSTFVLVHGGWSGGWMWRYVRQLLRARGYAVFTPTLTGLGERQHLATPAVDLSLHIADIVGVLESEELTGVILVGHSYGGMVITGVADRAADRLAGLVYLDAFVPGDGQALTDLAPQAAASAPPEVWQIPPLPRTVVGRIEEGGPAEEEVWRLVRRRGPQPRRTFTEPARLTNPAAHGLARSYIYCACKEQDDPFTGFARRFRADPRWRSHELATDHYPMLATPRELTDLLCAIAQEDAEEGR